MPSKLVTITCIQFSVKFLFKSKLYISIFTYSMLGNGIISFFLSPYKYAIILLFLSIILALSSMLFLFVPFFKPFAYQPILVFDTLILFIVASSSKYYKCYFRCTSFSIICAGLQRRWVAISIKHKRARPYSYHLHFLFFSTMTKFSSLCPHTRFGNHSNAFIVCCFYSTPAVIHIQLICSANIAPLYLVGLRLLSFH